MAESSFRSDLLLKKRNSCFRYIDSNLYGEKLVTEGLFTDETLKQQLKNFKVLLDDQFKNAKDYKPKIEWFEGTWSRYKRERGKDKRGITG